MMTQPQACVPSMEDSHQAMLLSTAPPPPQTPSPPPPPLLPSLLPLPPTFEPTLGPMAATMAPTTAATMAAGPTFGPTPPLGFDTIEAQIEELFQHAADAKPAAFEPEVGMAPCITAPYLTEYSAGCYGGPTFLL